MTPGSNSLAASSTGSTCQNAILLKSLWVLLKHNPLIVFLSPWWFLRGRVYLKRQITRRVSFDVSCLPCHIDFLRFLTPCSPGRRGTLP